MFKSKLLIAIQFINGGVAWLVIYPIFRILIPFLKATKRLSGRIKVKSFHVVSTTVRKFRSLTVDAPSRRDA